MAEHRTAPSSDGVLGEGFVTEWRARIAELDERAADIDLDHLLPPEELGALRGEVRVTISQDPDTFLRRQVVIFLEKELDDSQKQLGFTGYIQGIIDDINYGNTFT